MSLVTFLVCLICIPLNSTNCTVSEQFSWIVKYWLEQKQFYESTEEFKKLLVNANQIKVMLTNTAYVNNL